MTCLWGDVDGIQHILLNPSVADVGRDSSEDRSSLANGSRAVSHFGFAEAADSDLDSVDQDGASIISL